MSDNLLRLVPNLRLTESESSANVWQQEQEDEVAPRLATFGCKLVVQEHTNEDTDRDENA